MIEAPPPLFPLVQMMALSGTPAAARAFGEAFREEMSKFDILFSKRLNGANEFRSNSTRFKVTLVEESFFRFSPKRHSRKETAANSEILACPKESGRS